MVDDFAGYAERETKRRAHRGGSQGEHAERNRRELATSDWASHVESQAERFALLSKAIFADRETLDRQYREDWTSSPWQKSVFFGPRRIASYPIFAESAGHALRPGGPYRSSSSREPHKRTHFLVRQGGWLAPHKRAHSLARQGVP